VQDIVKRSVPLSPLAFSVLSAAKQISSEHGSWFVDDIDGNPYGVRLSNGDASVDIFLVVKMSATWAEFSPVDSLVADLAKQICLLFRGIGTELAQRRWFTKHRDLLESKHDISLGARDGF
jgi:hypothetical protein